MNIKKLINELKDTESFIETNEKAGLIFTPNVNGAYGCYNVANTLNTIYQNKVGWFSGDIPKRDIYDEKTAVKQPVLDMYKEEREQILKELPRI